MHPHPGSKQGCTMLNQCWFIWLSDWLMINISNLLFPESKTFFLWNFFSLTTTSLEKQHLSPIADMQSWVHHCKYISVDFILMHIMHQHTVFPPCFPLELQGTYSRRTVMTLSDSASSKFLIFRALKPRTPPGLAVASMGKTGDAFTGRNYSRRSLILRDSLKKRP